MKKWIALATGVALAATATASQAADKLTLQLQWVTQAQFAGYYVAKDKGYYADEDLEVEIRPGGPDIAPPQVLGEMRDHLHKEVQDKVVAEVDKTLTNHPIDKIEAIVKGELEGA